MKDKRGKVLQTTAQVLRALWDLIALWSMTLLLRSLSDDAANALVDGLQDKTVVFSAPGMDFDDEAAIRAYVDCVKEEIERMSRAGEN